MGYSINILWHSFLREIYNKFALKIIDDQEELVVNKNNVKIQITNFPHDTSGFKTYYLYQLKLNKTFRLFDTSVNISDIIDRVLQAEPNNAYF